MMKAAVVPHLGKLYFSAFSHFPRFSLAADWKDDERDTELPGWAMAPFPSQRRLLPRTPTHAESVLYFRSSL
jgi:hypothetical protein